MPIVTCVICRKEFTAKVAWAKTCCNPECRAEHKRRAGRALTAKKRKEAKFETRSCAHCGEDFKAIVNVARKYCSAQCRKDHELVVKAERDYLAFLRAKITIDTIWPALNPAIHCQDYDYIVHTNHAAFCPFPGVAA